MRLGAKLKQNGKHQVGKAGKKQFLRKSAWQGRQYERRKPACKKVKSKKKMAGLESRNIKLAANGR
jgi:hypothetical protein